MSEFKFEDLQRSIKEDKFKITNDYKKIFDSFRSELIKELDNLSVAISNALPKQTLYPVIKWAQSEKDLFVFFKLSHRFDAPGCLEVHKDPIINFDFKNIKMVANCVQAGNPIQFIMDFKLKYNIKNLKLERTSVGTYLLVLEKTDDIIWEDLFENFEERAKYNLKIWYELEDNYPEAMNSFYEKSEAYIKKIIRNNKTNKKKTSNATCKNSWQTYLK